MKTRKMVFFALGVLLFGGAVLTPGITSTARAAGGCGMGQNSPTPIGQQTLSWQMLGGNHQDIFIEIPCTPAGNGIPPVAIGQQRLPELPQAQQKERAGCQCLEAAVYPDTAHTIKGGFRDLLKSPGAVHTAVWIHVNLWVTCLDPNNKSNTCTIPFDITQKADWSERAPFSSLDSGTPITPSQTAIGFKSGGTGASTTDISTKLQINCTAVCDGVPHLSEIWLVYEANFDSAQGQLLTGHLSFTINAEGCGKTDGEPSFDLTVKL